MDDLICRIEGRAGRITFNRPAALNALNAPMCAALDDALRAWAAHPDVDLVIIDAEGERAFCAGGDVAAIYRQAKAGNTAEGQAFWHREYRMNLRIASYPKPIVSLMHGFTMGGGVGVGCHASHRIVGETTQIAMPECLIGLVPDVGGTFLLAHSPGRLGEYLGTTGNRMGPADALYAGFADHFVPMATWPALISALLGGDINLLNGFLQAAPEGKLQTLRPQIDAHFAGETYADILRSLRNDSSDFATATFETLARMSPLSASVTVEMLHRLGDAPYMDQALALEYRFTFRAQKDSDLLEGIRAALIDKDRRPNWRHSRAEDVTGLDVSRLLMPLGAQEWTAEDAE
jgi:enoyl-CoA hydratase